MRLLRLISWPYLRKHAVRSLLTVIGIVLGVAVFVAMHTANQAVFFAFERTVPSHRTFGFHGIFNMIPVIGADRFWELYLTLDDCTTARVDSTKEYLDATCKDIESSAQMDMINLQSLMGARQTAIQLSTNLVAALAESMKAVVTNIR